MKMISNNIISFVIAVIMIFTAIPAGAQIDFMFEPMYNYTENCTVKLTFDSSKDFVSLLKELEIPEEIEIYSNLEKFLETLLSIEGKMFVQADISNDMKKAKLAITAESFNSVDFNSNLQINVTARAGLWVVYDFTDIENPMFEIVYSLPTMEKYVHINLFEIMPEDKKQEFLLTIEGTLQPEKVEETNTFFKDLLEKHADISVSLTKATIKIDNDGLIAMIDEAIPFLITFVQSPMPEAEREEMAEFLNTLSFEGLQLLGENGIVCTYNLTNGQISSASTVADISIDISKIYTKTMGEAWEYVSSGKLDFTVEFDTTVSKIGNTAVEMPAITEENSISFSEMIEEGIIVYPYEEYEPHYPYWWVYGNAEKLPVINGEIYVPLRMSLECAYEDSVQISFENGVITASSEYFPGFKTMVLTNGSDQVYLDGNGKTLTTVIIENGVTYVNHKLFTEIFGWEFSDAVYYMVEDYYYYCFITQPEYE